MRPPDNLYHQNIATDDTRSSCSLNRCNLSPWIIGSEEFQENPQPLEIDGARETDRRLFARLEAIPNPDERSRLFHDYVRVKFSLDEVTSVRSGQKKRGFHSCLDLLRYWGVDSNGPAGAVLKSWAESRFGLLATYHKGRLAEDAAAREHFRVDRMLGAARSIGVLMQLDLLYTFCQYELRRRFPGESSVLLYRGTHDAEEYNVRSNSPRREIRPSRAQVVQFNNLSSFTSDPEVAWEFGSRAWEVRVPLAKIVFFSGLLPQSGLFGESEHLVLGGYYRVTDRLM